MRHLPQRTRTAFAGALALVLASPVAAQTVRLEDVVAAAIKGTPQTQHEDERVNRAAGQLQQARGAFDWRATAESGWEQLYVPKVDPNGFLTSKLSRPDVWRSTVGIGRRFRNGIDVAPGVTWATGSSATAGQTFGLTQPRPALNLNVPLFRGRGGDNEFASSERAAQASLEGANLGRGFAGERAVYDAVQVYWRCLATRQSLEVLDADQRGSDDYLATLRDLVARGQIEPTLLDRATANQAVNRVAVGRAQAADQACRRDLAIAMGGSAAGPLPTAVGEFPAMDGLNQAAIMLNEQALTTTALATRRDLMALARFEAAEGERVRGARNGVQPQVDIYIDPTRVMVRYTQSIGSNATQGALAAAVASESEARINIVQLQNQIRVDVSDQVRNLKESLSNWTALTESAGLLGSVVSDAQTRAAAGVITQQQYRDAQNELAEVRRQVIDAKLQYASSLAALRLSTGTIKTGDGITPDSLASVFRSLPNQ